MSKKCAREWRRHRDPRTAAIQRLVRARTAESPALAVRERPGSVLKCDTASPCLVTPAVALSEHPVEDIPGAAFARANSRSLGTAFASRFAPTDFSFTEAGVTCDGAVPVEIPSRQVTDEVGHAT